MNGPPHLYSSPGDWAAVSARLMRRVLHRIAAVVPLKPVGFWRGELVALVCVSLAAGLRFLLQPVVGEHIPVVVFYPFVFIAAVWGGGLSGVTVLLIGAALAEYFWLPASGNVVTLITFAIVSLFAILMARLFIALMGFHQEEVERSRLLTNEINHRSNNLLSLVHAIVSQAAQSSDTIPEFRSNLEGRLIALSKAQLMLTTSPETPPDLRTLIGSLIEPFGQEKFVIAGSTTGIPRRLVTPCALLIHELATNATKYARAAAVARARRASGCCAGAEGIRLAGVRKRSPGRTRESDHGVCPGRGPMPNRFVAESLTRRTVDKSSRASGAAPTRSAVRRQVAHIRIEAATSGICFRTARSGRRRRQPLAVRFRPLTRFG
jgi:two-component sensor histidine kinase